jgi:hypothetical protein
MKFLAPKGNMSHILNCHKGRAALRHKEKYFVKYQNIVLEIQQMVSSIENVSWKIFGDGCVGHKCMDMTVARPTT